MRDRNGYTGDENERTMLQLKGKCVCPVCGEEIHEDNLPDKESVITENVYHLGGVVITSSSVWLLVDFWHEYTIGGETLDSPHKLTAVVTCEFDRQGRCIGFEIKEIRAKR